MCRSAARSGSAVLPALAALGGVRLAMTGAGIAATATALLFATVSDGRPAAHSRSPGQTVAGVLRIPGFKPLLAVGLLYVLGLGAILAHYVGALRDAGLSHTEAAAGFPASTSRPRSHDSSGGGWPTAAAAPGGPGRCATSAS